MRRGRALVVDDSAVNRRVLVQALDRLGFQVAVAEHGREALDLLRGRGDPFDVVLLDVLMPVMDGTATLEAIKADESIHHLPVIMVSAVEELATVVRCIELGATDYLTKPFDFAVLQARVHASLAEKRLRDLERDHLVQVDRVIEAALAFEAGQYDAERLDSVAHRDDALGRLARMLQRMAREVDARERSLRQEVAELRIEIDRARQAGKVAEITESDYYQDLRSRAQSLKALMHEQGHG